MADRPQILGPGEGETLRPGFAIKAALPQLVMTEALYAPGERGPDPHVHHEHADGFYILEGSLVVELGPDGRPHETPEGSFMLIPPDVVHSFHNPGPGEARFINLHAPGMGFDEYLRSGYTAPFDQWDPPADGGRPAEEVLIQAPGEGRPLNAGDARGWIKAGAADGLGSLTCNEMVIAPGFPGPPLHRHAHTMDSFYVLEGTLTINLAEGAEEVPAGGYALVPPGHPHTFSNPGEQAVRALNVSAPGGIELYVTKVAEAMADGSLTPELMAAVGAEHDVEPV